MPRRSGVPKREIIADPIYNSTVVTKLINQVMNDGKRGTAQRICYDAFEIIKERRERMPSKCSIRRWKTSCPFWKLRPVG